MSVAARPGAARPSVSRTTAGRLPVARQPGNPAAVRPAAKRPVAARPAAAYPILEDSLRSFAHSVKGSNAERNLHMWAKRQVWHKLLPATFDFMISINDPGSKVKKSFQQGEELVDMMHSCLLPHETCSSIFTNGRELFHHLLGDKATLQGFWDAASAANDDWYKNHPVIAATPAELCIPVGTHGDDAGVHGDEQVLVITWNGLTFKHATLDSRHVFTMAKVAHLKPALR